MQQTPSSQSDLIAVLEQYQAVCNRYDVAAAVALFAADGCIEVHKHRSPSATTLSKEKPFGVHSSRVMYWIAPSGLMDGTCTRNSHYGTDE